MKISIREITVRNVHLALLWGASLLVPQIKRPEWNEEWRTELWYVLRECSSKSSTYPRSILEASAFCFGAYQDAIWLRKQPVQQHLPRLRARISAPTCLLLLTVVLLASSAIALLSPSVATVEEMAQIRVFPCRRSDSDAKPCDSTSGVKAENEVRASLSRSQRYFDGFSHYSLARDRVQWNSITGTEWGVAHAGSDFFVATKLSLRHGAIAHNDRDKLPRLVLSEDTWRRDFGGRQDITGTIVRVGSVNAVITGTTSVDLPGKANAWLLGAGLQDETNNAEFVVGHLSPTGYFQAGPRWALSLFGIVLAMLLLPWLMKLSIGEYESCSQKPKFVGRAKSWTFLAAKIFLLLAITYFVSLGLDCMVLQPSSRFSGYIQFSVSFTLGLLGLMWAIQDQRGRCPFCLRSMTYSAEVGESSRTFLAWRGTELACTHGHALLHVPAFPTSWFGARRWVSLDQSWSFLFVQSDRS